MDNASRFAKNRLAEASRAKRGAATLAVGLTTAAIGLVVLISVALLDYWLMLVPSVRLAGFVVLCLFVGGGFFLLFKILRRPMRLKEAALDAEAAKPEIGCELSTAAEYLAGERKPSQKYEGELAAALEDKAATHLRKVQVPYWQRAIRPAIIVTLLVLIALFFTALASGGFTAFRRSAMPWANIHYTEVEVKPGNVELPIGRDLEVKSVFTGRVPKNAKFQWQDEGNPKWQFASLTKNEQGEFTYPLKNVRTPLKYRVAGSDALSPEFSVQPYAPAEVKDWKVDLQFPSYTKREKTTQTTPEITALRGSTASIRIAPNVKLSKAQLRFKEGPAVDLAPTENGFWKTDITISKDAEFDVVLSDEKGRPGADSALYKITTFPDEVPVVEIAEPGQDIRAAATNTVPVKIKAMDDFGIEELKLVYHRLGGPEEIITARRNGETNTEFTAEIPLSPLALKEYELVAYHALAVDNNTLDGPGIGKSDVFFIEITNEEGGDCKCQGKGEKVNLLVIQKQIVADTVALGPNPEALQLEDLAKRQADAIEFGQMYHKAISAGGAPEAAEVMATAVREMEAAQTALQQLQAKTALPSEERALASLYQVVKLMPQLENLPTVPPEQKPEEEPREEKPPELQVVLEAIKKKKEQEPDNQELAEVLEEAQRLQEAQAGVNIGIQNTASNPNGGAPSESQIDRSGKAEPTDKKPSEKKPAQLAANSEKASKAAAAAKKGKGGEAKKAEKNPYKAAGKKGEKTEKPQKGQKGQKGQNPEKNEKGEGEGGEGDQMAKGNKPGKSTPKPSDEPQEESEQDEPDPQELLAKQDELSKEAAELAEKLERLAGKDKRLGHGVSRKVDEAAAKMKAASEALGRSDKENAGTQGAQAGAHLESAVAMLERILHDRPERVDVSKEDAPKRYEAAISEYFKALSYDN